MKQPAVDAAIERVAREAKISADAAAARVFQERFPGKSVPETTDAIRAALLEGEPPAADAISALADQRLKAVRAAVKKAGIDSSRLLEGKPPEGATKSPEGAEEDEPRVTLDLVEPDNPRRPGRRSAEFPQWLTGNPDTTTLSAR
jgi:hypothetical protein